MPSPLLLHMFYNFDIGGVQMRSVALMNALGPRYRHAIIALGGNFDAAKAVDKHVEMERLSPSLRGGFWRRLRGFGDVIRASGADLLLTYNWASVEAALANRLFVKRPHIHHESGFGREEAAKQFKRRVWMRRLALRNCYKIVVPSRTLLQLARTEWRQPQERMALIFDGIDAARFSHRGDPSILPGWTRPSSQPVIGTVAPLRAEKNIPRLLRLIKNLHAMGMPAHLVIVGDGPERAALKRYADSLGLGNHVYFAGFVAQVEKTYGLFDLFAITSDTEQLPNGVLQAMAARRAVLGTDVGDIKAMVAPVNRRFIVPADDEEALLNAARDLLADEGLRRQLGGANAREIPVHYALEDMVKRYDQLYQGALS